MKSYYNTNKETGITLKESNQKARTQEDEVLGIFKRHTRLTASDAWGIYINKNHAPITSIRRAITNLCKRGNLIKTETLEPGIYGRNEHVYKYGNEVIKKANPALMDEYHEYIMPNGIKIIPG